MTGSWCLATLRVSVTKGVPKARRFGHAFFTWLLNLRKIGDPMWSRANGRPGGECAVVEARDNLKSFDLRGVFSHRYKKEGLCGSFRVRRALSAGLVASC